MPQKMLFFGVSTGQSSSRKMFPVWMDILGIDGELVGVDFPINAPMQDYRQAVQAIKDDTTLAGALITTHKINVLNAAHDLFDELTEDAQQCGEVSCIYKREGRLIGHAVDPVTSARSMRQFIPSGYWGDAKADVLCIGAGGSAVAITVHFLTRATPPDRPRRLILVNRTQGKLDSIRQLVGRLPDSGIAFEYHVNADPTFNDALMSNLPDGSMVINATGMGKDIPGSPITPSGVFPHNGIAWELNYRGELDFLHQARAQAQARNLTVVDGWHYFLEGWALIVGKVFAVDITPDTFDKLAHAAQIIR